MRENVCVKTVHLAQGRVDGRGKACQHTVGLRKGHSHSRARAFASRLPSRTMKSWPKHHRSFFLRKPSEQDEACSVRLAAKEDRLKRTWC